MMHKFIKRILLFTIPLIFCLLSLLVYWTNYKQNTCDLNWRLPEKTHMLFLGASLIEYGINDSLINGSINLASSSERYLFTYLKLNEILQVNPQVDTVFLQFAPTDTWKNTDTKYYMDNEFYKFFPLYFPYFSKSEWKIYLKINFKEVLLYFLNIRNITFKNNDIVDYGHFLKSHEIMDTTLPDIIPEWKENGSSINRLYLDKIIDLIESHDIKLYFVYPPVLEPELFYDQENYYDFHNQYYKNIELLDYSHLEIPKEYRKDKNHLNYYGANYFTKHLKSKI